VLPAGDRHVWGIFIIILVQLVENKVYLYTRVCVYVCVTQDVQY
jgi:hypothetical protein